MKIGIISDTHDDHRNVLGAVKIFNELGVKYVLHAGDMVSPFTAKAFSGLNGAKFIAVYGNNEGERELLKSTINEFGGEIYDRVYEGEIDGKKFFMVHNLRGLDAVAGSGKYDVVIYGHTHKRDVRWVGKTLVINPGETTDWLTGRPGVAVLDLERMESEEIDLG